jgi:3-oxoacyl-[acyl-carrier-protein] synthase-1
MAYYLNELGIICALGSDKRSVYSATVQGSQTGMVPSDRFSPGNEVFLGFVSGELPHVPAQFNEFDCRNNRLLLAALGQIRESVDRCIARFGADRVGVVLGTSTSGFAEGEKAIRQYVEVGSTPEAYHFHQQQLSGASDFICAYLELGGPSMAVSTACSSSANALASARRLIDLDTCDAVIVGGADSLCQLTVQGFSALEATSAGLSNPFSKNRDGINIGEGAALMLLTRERSEIELLGVGSTSDAHHISAPDPSGKGAVRAMQSALRQGNLSADQVDYVNLHGTGTPLNDAMESQAVFELFGNQTWCSSSKPMTGHTLGAAGAIEIGLCWLLLNNDYNASHRNLPHMWDGQVDAEIAALRFAAANEGFARPPRVALSNSFAFGGNNCSVLIGAHS